MERILCAGDIIMIGARFCIEACVKVRVDLPATINDYVIRKKHIQLIYKFFRIFYWFTFEMRIEISGIHTSVGAPASCDGDGLFKFEADTFFEHLLHGNIARLDLPAVISFSVICQM